MHQQIKRVKFANMMSVQHHIRAVALPAHRQSRGIASISDPRQRHWCGRHRQADTTCCASAAGLRRQADPTHVGKLLAVRFRDQPRGPRDPRPAAVLQHCQKQARRPAAAQACSEQRASSKWHSLANPCCCATFTALPGWQFGSAWASVCGSSRRLPAALLCTLRDST